MIWEYIVVSVAGALFTRCVAWHVPKLALMIWRGTRQPRPLATPSPIPEVTRALEDERWARMFADNPLAFWLDPYLWEPAPPAPAKPRISSERRFDAKRGTVPARTYAELAYQQSMDRQNALNAYDQHLQSAQAQNSYSGLLNSIRSKS